METHREIERDLDQMRADLYPSTPEEDWVRWKPVLITAVLARRPLLGLLEHASDLVKLVYAYRLEGSAGDYARFILTELENGER